MRFVRAESREDVLAEVAEELRLSGVTDDIADQVVADFLASTGPTCAASTSSSGSMA